MVTLRGAVGVEPGTVTDWRTLRDRVRRTIIDEVDHVCLNDGGDVLHAVLPAAEISGLDRGGGGRRRRRLHCWEPAAIYVMYDSE